MTYRPASTHSFLHTPKNLAAMMSESWVMADYMRAMEEIEMNNLSYLWWLYFFISFILVMFDGFEWRLYYFYSLVMRRQRSRNGPVLQPTAAHQTSLREIASPNATFFSSNVSRLLRVSSVWCFSLFMSQTPVTNY